ncbi:MULTISPECIES: transglycosylase SLT domain-containing protein [Streptomycetaceae]|nr:MULTISPECIES: transglycosylase SLT domain-containing protein [Streptomycetaceae]MYS58979.1 transglycosylase SLT domain-containing protein [Streptomyces sp. SID5468]CCB74681.1 conserved exported protein of unknown function [Streptantibioticus cattleyicolor NRRL 8057 = DSM 46488]
MAATAADRVAKGADRVAKSNVAAVAATRLTRNHLVSAAGLAAVGASVLGFTVTPGTAHAAVPANPVMTVASYTMGGADKPEPQVKQIDVTAQAAGVAKQATAQATAAKNAKDWPKPPAEVHTQPEAANRSESRQPIQAQPAAPSYPDNLDGWIRHALDIMHQNGIPGTYQGIHRNVMRESSGNPYAINNWDVNAAAGIPSKGLLQVIQPTFDTYHVAGTANDLYDPVANIVAACNYAAHRYGSIDNVNSAY